MTIMVMMMTIIRIVVMITVSSGGRFEVRRRDVAVARWDGGGALVNYELMIIMIIMIIGIIIIVLLIIKMG